MADIEIMIQPAQAHYINRLRLEKLLLRLFRRPIAVVVSIHGPHEAASGLHNLADKKCQGEK